MRSRPIDHGDAEDAEDVSMDASVLDLAVIVAWLVGLAVGLWVTRREPR